MDKIINWEQPILTNNGTIGIDFFAVTAGGGAITNDAWKAFDGNINTYCNKMNTDAWFQFVTLYPITIQSITLESSGSLPCNGKFQISYDSGTTWEDIGTWTDYAETGSFAEIEFNENIISTGTTGNYFRFYSLGKSLYKPTYNADFSKINITATTQVDIKIPANDIIIGYKKEKDNTKIPANDIIIGYKKEKDNTKIPANDIIIGYKKEKDIPFISLDLKSMPATFTAPFDFYFETEVKLKNELVYHTDIITDINNDTRLGINLNLKSWLAKRR